MKRLDHPNILPIIGVCLESKHEGGLPFMVLPFMVNGDLKSYLKNKRKNPAYVDQLSEVRVQLFDIRPLAPFVEFMFSKRNSRID